MKKSYEDIIHLPHPVSKTRARLSAMDRAAQFSPFAALTGFDAAVEEMARLTTSRIELDVDGRAELNEALSELSRRIPEGVTAAVTHFVPDMRKAGGCYVTAEGKIRRVNSREGYLTMEDGREIAFGDILTVQILE